MSVDYTHLLGRRLWRFVDINPLQVNPANPSGPRIRPMAADLQRVYGDPNLLGSTLMHASVGESDYDAMKVTIGHIPRVGSMTVSGECRR
jgi:hypothetical protein